MKLIIQDLEYLIKTFNLRVFQLDDNNNTNIRFQELITCDFMNIENIETIYNTLLDKFDGSLEIQIENYNNLNFENYELDEINLSINDYGELNNNITFKKNIV